MARDGGGGGDRPQIPNVVSEDREDRAARVGQDDFAPPRADIRQGPQEQQREIAPRDPAQQRGEVRQREPQQEERNVRQRGNNQDGQAPQQDDNTQSHTNRLRQDSNNQGRGR